MVSVDLDGHFQAAGWRVAVVWRVKVTLAMVEVV